MSFLQRLKGRGVRDGERSGFDDQATMIEKIAQLDIDVFLADEMIVVYAQAAGTDISDVRVSIEGDADIVVIEGTRARPEALAFPARKPDGAFVTQESVWGDYYRRIILPESVDIKQADAKMKDGVLVLQLPIMHAREKQKVKLNITKASVIKRV